MDIAKKLVKYRKEINLSQEEVADRLNVSRQTVSKWETGQSMPDLDKVVPLCRLYNISTEELLTGEKNELINNIDNMEEKYMSKKNNNQKNPADYLFKRTTGVLNLVVLAVYLAVSFATGDWTVTWIVWPVYAVVMLIVSLIAKAAKEDLRKDFGDNKNKNN